MSESDRLNRISGDVLDASIRIHEQLGPGLSLDFGGMWFQDICRPDLIIDSAVVVEVKSAEKLYPVFGKQVLTYLRIGDYRLGLVVNFGGALLKDNFQRIVNRF